MRKDIFTKSVIFFSVMLVFLAALSGVFSFMSLPITVNSVGLSTQGAWSEDDVTKSYSMSITHDKYDNVHGKDWSGPIGWSRSKPEGDNSSMADPAMKNLTSVTLTARQGNNALSFSIKRKDCSNNESDSPGKVDGYDVNSGRILIYVNNKIISTPEYNLRKPGAYLDFKVDSGNVNLLWNTNYEIKLVLAFQYYNWYHHDVWYYKGIATTTIRFNDTIAPTGELSGVSNGGETNTNVTFSWNDSRAKANWSWDSNDYTNKKIEIDNSKEGNHTIVLTDQVGLSSTYTFKIDSTAPYSNLSYPTYGSKMYTADKIIFAPTDNLSKITSLSVKFQENGEWASNQTDAEKLGYNVQFLDNKIVVPNDNNNGDWYFQAEDNVGNISSPECVVLMALSFGNQWRIRDAYKQNTWYNVVLPQNIFSEQAGTYSVATYETALAFATAKEWDFRVTEVAGGWMYVSSANGNLSQLYTDKIVLDEVIEKYAKSYITERKIAKNGTNNFLNIINDELVIDETALTRQHLEAREFMTLDLPVYFMDTDFKFDDPRFAVDTYVKIQMVGTDTQKVERDEIMLDYEISVGTQIFASGNNAQGYYLVTEWDTAGNEEQYYVYIDVSAPELEAYATYGNGEQKSVRFTENLIAEYAGTFRYMSLDLSSISDLVDKYTTIKITGRKLSEVYFVQDDELPCLDGVDYYGNYTIEVYDRSGNTLSFVVSIAGEQPYMSNSSLSSETSCRLTLNVNDKTNSIIQLKLYRILYDGTYVELLQDHKDVTVEASTLQYTLTTGGKYTIWYQDLYGRTVECTPIFYTKGLPTGTLSGVIEGGITNKNVSLKFNDSDKLILYKVENGIRSKVEESTIFSCVFNETTHKGIATLTASEETSGSYVFFLHNAEEISLFVEYTFTIDCVIAPVYIFNSNGIEVVKNSFSNKPFSIYWNEAVTLRYYTDTTTGGELGAVRYEMGKTLVTNGIYYFTLKDAVGNEETFTISLDTMISYQLGGEYVELGEHNYLAKNNLQFTITEKNAVQLFDTTPAVINGGMITLEGFYTIRIIDAYGNEAIISICIDKTAPVINLDGVENGNYTKNNVVVTFTDAVELLLVNKNDQILMTLENGAVFDTEGSYRIMAVDEVGNTTVATFTINRSVPYESNIPDTGITTNAVTFKFLGTLENEIVQKDGEYILSKSKYTEAGRYSIFAVDDIGNEFYFSFIILPNRMQKLHLEKLEDLEIDFAIKDKLAFSVEVVNGNLTLLEAGNYEINMKNTKKNFEFSFSFVIDNDVLVNTTIPNNSFTAESVEVTFGEEVTQEVKLEGEVISKKNKYTEPGNYEIKVVDDLGNETVLCFRILPARVRELILENLQDVELLLATKDGKDIVAEIDNEKLCLTDSGHYVLFFQRITGEVFNFACEVDNVPPTVEIKKEAGSFKTQNASKENLTATLFRDDKEVAYTIGKKVNGAGNYTLTIVDELGNENVYHFTVTEPLNWASYASIAGLGLLVFVAVLVVFLAKRRVKIR